MRKGQPGHVAANRAQRPQQRCPAAQPGQHGRSGIETNDLRPPESPLEGLAARPGTATEVADSLWRSPLELTALQQAETYFLFQSGVPIIAMGDAVECFTNLAGVWHGITPVIMG